MRDAERPKPGQYYCPQCGREVRWDEWTREGPFSEIKRGWKDRLFGFARDPTKAVVNGGRPPRVKNRLRKELDKAERQGDAEVVAMMDCLWPTASSFKEQSPGALRDSVIDD